MAARRPLLVLMAVASLVAVAAIALAADGPADRYAFVARGDNPIDALAAAPVAGRLDAPVLLTPPTSLSDAARDGLLAADPDVIVIAGGIGAVSQAVEDELREIFGGVAEVRRVAGSSRYDTAQALASLIGEYDPAFAYDDSNAFGVACTDGQVMTGISGNGEAECATDEVDGGDAATVGGFDAGDFLMAGDVTGLPAGVVTVSHTGNNVTSGDALQAAVAATTTPGTVILVGPGDFELATGEALSLSVGVNLTGFGSTVTVLRGQRSGGALLSVSEGTVDGVLVSNGLDAGGAPQSASDAVGVALGEASTLRDSVVVAGSTVGSVTGVTVGGTGILMESVNVLAGAPGTPTGVSAPSGSATVRSSSVAGGVASSTGGAGVLVYLSSTLDGPITDDGSTTCLNSNNGTAELDTGCSPV